MASKQVVIGVEIDGPNIRVGKIKGDKLVDFLEDSIPYKESKEIILDKIIKVIEKVFSEDVAGIGIGMQGIVDSENGIAVNPVRIDSLKDTNLREILGGHFQIPVYVDNDANCFALGVKYFGRGKFYRDVIGLIVAEGLGAGVIIDNRLYAGKNSSAGEFGQIPYKDHTIEFYSCGQFFSKLHSVDVNDVIENADAGDKKALNLFEEFGDYLGQTIQLIMHSYDPQIILLGGPVRKGFDHFKTAMWKRIRTSPLKDALEKIIVDVNDVPHITLLGAAALYYNAQQNQDFEAEKKRRLKAEEELLQERNTLYSILENIPDRIYLKDIEGRYTKVNKSMVSALGYESESQIIGKNETEIFKTSAAEKNHLQDMNVIENGKALLNDESKSTDKESNEIWLLSSRIPIKNIKDEVVGLVGISRDITGIKKAEQKLKSFSENLQAAKKETDNILENVDEGLFLLNEELDMGSQYSKALEGIFQVKKIAGQNFIKFMRGRIADDEVETLENFLVMLFDKEYEENVILELNPLHKTKVYFANIDSEKTLTFNFKRIYNRRGNIKELIVIVKDITDQVKLEEKLKESEAQAKKQMEWVMSIMRVEPSMMRDFIDGMKSEFETIDGYFKAVKQDKDYDLFTDKLYRSIHLIKGNAAILNLTFFADELHNFEDKISSVQNEKQIKPENIQHLFKSYLSIKDGNVNIDELLSRMSQLHSQIRTTRSYENEMLIKSMQNYVKQISADSGKKIELVLKDFNTNIIPYKYRLLVREVLIQLIRNSVAHGIENEDERKLSGKPQKGTITISCCEENEKFCFSAMDDGRGIDLAKLVEKLKNSKRWDDKKLASLSDKEIAQMIFESGVSTNDTVTKISGRGVGLDAVKSKIEKYKGEIELNYKKGEFCQFNIKLPFKDSKEKK